MNLWNNAIKYTEIGVINFSAKLIESTIIKVSLKDSGIGYKNAIFFYNFLGMDEL